ncbi:ABC transporter permease subunit [Cupriavidus basilensis]
MLGLVNGSFYAILSLGLAVIFGMLNIINFAHGALFMVGAFVAWAGAGVSRHQLLVVAAGGAGAGRAGGYRHRARPAAVAVRARPPVRAAAHLRAGARNRRPVPLPIRRLGAALFDSRRNGRRLQPRLHVPAEIPRVGGIGASLYSVPADLVHDREDPPRRLPARRHREIQALPKPSASTCR